VIRDIHFVTTYLYFFLYIRFLNKYIYGVLLKETQCIFFLKDSNFVCALQILKKNQITNFSLLLDIIITDLLQFNILKRYIVTYVFLNYLKQLRFLVKLFIKGYEGVYSIGLLYSSSIWLEREAWDLYGIKFVFHGCLRRILTDYMFQGFPLRKDFPLIGYTEIFYNEIVSGIFVNVVEVMQVLRFYEFSSPWYTWK